MGYCHSQEPSLTSNYQWTAITTFIVSTTFNFYWHILFFVYYIYIYIYIYHIPRSYPIPLTVTICNKEVVVHEWINSMPIATPSPFLWSLLSWEIQYFSVHKLNWKGKGYAKLWIIEKELNFVANCSRYIIRPQCKCHE